MTYVDHLKGNSPENEFLEVAFGTHAVRGQLGKSILYGGAIHVQHLIGEAFGKGWKGIVGAWFRGINRDDTKFVFYPGKQSTGDSDPVQGVDSVFDKDTPHSNTAWVRLICPSGSETGVPDADTKNNPPDGSTFIIECQLGDIYDDAGTITSTDQFITNPSDIIAFASMEIRRLTTSRINWESLDILRAICDQQETPDYTTLPQGVGLTGKYYDGDNFDTLVRSRVDPIVEFESSSGVPELGLSPDDFSVRWEGKVQAEYSETYTFQVVHNDGAKLWVNGILIIDQWGTSGTHTGTATLTSDNFYDIKLEWKDSSGNAECKLQWSSTTQPLETIPQNRLYPKNEARNRFECHLAVTQPTGFDEMLRQILFSCNGGYQDADGKLNFFCIDEQTSSFDFDETNIKKNTLQYYPRFSQQELLNLPNRFIASGRDLDSRYLQEFDPKVYYDVPELQEIAGRINEEIVNVGNSYRWQTLKNLEHYAKLRTAPMICEFEGMPETLQVLPGDKTTVSHSLFNLVDAEFLALEATDKSIDDNPDERIFKLLKWD